eukprot:6010283-Amphidinium_carterae.1
MVFECTLWLQASAKAEHLVWEQADKRVATWNYALWHVASTIRDQVMTAFLMSISRSGSKRPSTKVCLRQLTAFLPVAASCCEGTLHKLPNFSAFGAICGQGVQTDCIRNSQRAMVLSPSHYHAYTSELQRTSAAHARMKTPHGF